jgi:hypothetical protein
MCALEVKMSSLALIMTLPFSGKVRNLVIFNKEGE